MNFDAQRKEYHEQQAEKFLKRKDVARAFYHLLKAAEHGFNLAEQAQGGLAQAHLHDAEELLALAEQMREQLASREPAEREAAAEHVQQQDNDAADLAGQWQLGEKPDVRLDDVGGLQEMKEALLEDVILPLQHPEAYQRFNEQAGGGILLYGPPGTGKTFVARAIAGELDADFFAVDAAQLKDKYVGETEKNMRRLFEAALSRERAVIFLDEVDALLGRRGNQKINLVNQFLVLADGLNNLPQNTMLLLLAATNRPWNIAEAALRPGRLGRHIYVGLPDEAARRQILEYHLRHTPLEEHFPFQELAGAMQGYSGADIAHVVSRARKRAIRRQLESGKDEVLTRTDMEHVMQDFTPSVRPQDLQAFERWHKERELQNTGS